MSKYTEAEIILESEITQEEYLTLRATTTWKQIKPERVASDDYLKFILVAAPGKSSFYEKLGFTKRDEQTGWGMVLNYNF